MNKYNLPKSVRHLYESILQRVLFCVKIYGELDRPAEVGVGSKMGSEKAWRRMREDLTRQQAAAVSYGASFVGKQTDGLILTV